MKKLAILLLAAMPAIVFQSCKKSTAFEKGQISFKANGSNVTCDIGVAGQLTFNNTITLSGTAQSGLTTKSINIVLPNAVMGVNESQESGDHLVITYSSMTDIYATHWDNDLVGAGSIDIEIMETNEIKGEFTATLKKQDGSGTVEITEGKAWWGN